MADPTCRRKFEFSDNFQVNFDNLNQWYLCLLADFKALFDENLIKFTANKLGGSGTDAHKTPCAYFNFIKTINFIKILNN